MFFTDDDNDSNNNNINNRINNNNNSDNGILENTILHSPALMKPNEKHSRWMKTAIHQTSIIPRVCCRAAAAAVDRGKIK